MGKMRREDKANDIYGVWNNTGVGIHKIQTRSPAHVYAVFIPAYAGKAFFLFIYFSLIYYTVIVVSPLSSPPGPALSP